MTIFGSLELGRSALMAQYKGMEVSGQNIANANTPGYTRQRVDMEAIIPAIAPGNKMAPGHGVRVTDIIRINSEFYHSQLVNNGSYKSRWDTLYEAYQGIEVIFMEPAEEGLNEYLEEFFDTWHDLAAAPESIAVRMKLSESTYNFTTMIQENYKRLSALREDFMQELELTVDDINRLLKEVAQTNEKIMLVDAYHQKSNELLDHLDLSLEKLGKLIDIQVYQRNNGTVDVYADGRMLVHEDQANPIELQTERYKDVYPEGIEEIAFTAQKNEENPLALSGNAEKGYQLVVNGNEETAYSLGIDKLQFKNDNADHMDVYIKSFKDKNGEDVSMTALKDYYMERLDPDHADYAAHEAALDDILSGDDRLFRVNENNGNVEWASIAVAGEDDISLEIKGDHPLGTFSFGGRINNDAGEPLAVNDFDLEIRDTVDVSDLYPAYEIVNHQGVNINFKHGRLQGLLETVNDAIPSVQKDMNELINRMVVEVNNIHREAYGLDFETGRNYFKDIEDNGIPPVLQFFMEEELFNDPDLIGTASGEAEPGNGDKALQMAQLRKERVLANGTATIPEFYRGLITSVGVKGEESEQMVKIFERTEAKLREQHESVTGVNIDEEMLNMVKFQNAWSAAAKFINYIDEMLAVLLNLGHR